MKVSELFKSFVKAVKRQPEAFEVDRLAAEIVSALALAPERRAHAAIVHFEFINEVEDTALVLLEVMYGVKAQVEAVHPDNWTYRQVTLSLEDEPVPFVGAMVTERYMGVAA